MARLNNVKRRPAGTARPPAVRQWSGSLIGSKPEGVDDYIARIARLVADTRTHLYFDTSFLMWLAKLGEKARAQFLAWQSTVSESRFHVPLWAAHEFFKHRLKNTVSKELGKEINAFDSAASNLYEVLSIYCSDQLFGFKNSGVLFLDEYRRTVQPVRAMLKLAEKSDQFEVGVQQVSTYIDARLLPGPLYDVVANIEEDERVRNRGVIPPSFKDAHKRGGRRTDGAGEESVSGGDNSFGDLVLWQEILRHAAKVRAHAVIVLTADRKNDWFENHHGDQGLTGTVRKRILRPRPVPAPHPLLVREAFDRGAGDLALIDPMYCGVLLERTGSAFASFAAAALDTHLPDPVKKPGAARSWAKRFGAEAHLLGGGREPDEGEPEETPFDPALLILDQLRPSSALPRAVAQVIRRIAEGDLAAREKTFAALVGDTLEQWDVTSLVALGQTALRAAEAGDQAALNFLSDLRDRSPEFPAMVRESIYFGALGAVYFDDEVIIRPPSGSQAAVVLLGLVTAPEVRHAAAAIGVALGTERKLFYRPGQEAALSVEVVIQPSADNKSPADLLAIKLDGIDLMTTLQTEEPLRFTSLLDRPPGAANLQVGAVLEVLTRYHQLPRQLVQTEANVDMIVRVPEYAGVELDV